MPFETPLSRTASCTSSVMSVTVRPPAVRRWISRWNVFAAERVSVSDTPTWTTVHGSSERGETGRKSPWCRAAGCATFEAPMSVRLVVDGAVYMLAAREAVRLVQRLRYRRSQGSLAAVGAAVILEWALSQDRPRAVWFTPEEAREVVRAAGREEHALYRALRDH